MGSEQKLYLISNDSLQASFLFLENLQGDTEKVLLGSAVGNVSLKNGMSRSFTAQRVIIENNGAKASVKVINQESCLPIHL